MKKYTVIGYYEDNGQIWMEHTKAEDTNQAVVNAVISLEGRQEPTLTGMTQGKITKENRPTDDELEDQRYFRGNVNIVGVFEGHRMEVSEQNSVCAALDWPGLEVGVTK